MSLTEVSDRATQTLRLMAGGRAERYIGEILLPTLQRGLRMTTCDRLELQEALASPQGCLQALLGVYAFCRRGRDRGELSSIAVEALRRASGPGDIASLLQARNASALWQSFAEVCREQGRKPMDQLNRGVVAGLAELAQELYRQDRIGSPALWIVRSIEQTGRIESQFLRMVDIRGVGPKLCSLFMRDVIWLFELEDRLNHADRLYVQPIDKWIRLLAPHVVEGLQEGEAADWILAGKLAKYARHAGLSGIAVNMGASYFGSREVRDPDLYEDCLKQALTQQEPACR